MNKASTHFLRGIVIFMGLVVLALCIFALPSIWRGGSVEFPTASTALLLIVVGMYVSVIPFYFALWQTLKLLGYIDRNTALSNLSQEALRKIKHSAVAIGILYMGGVPLLLPIAEADDAPGLLLFGFVIACTPFVVAVFAAVLEKLLKSILEKR